MVIWEPIENTDCGVFRAAATDPRLFWRFPFPVWFSVLLRFLSFSFFFFSSSHFSLFQRLPSLSSHAYMYSSTLLSVIFLVGPPGAGRPERGCASFFFSSFLSSLPLCLPPSFLCLTLTDLCCDEPRELARLRSPHSPHSSRRVAGKARKTRVQLLVVRWLARSLKTSTLPA